MELYLKAGPDGQCVGDCPFAHYVRAVMAFKNLDCSLAPCTAESKPSWLVEDHGGKMPCLKAGDKVITESSVIVEHINKEHPPLIPSGEEVKEKVSGLFPAMARLAKSLGPNPELEEKLVEAVLQLSSLLSSPGPWLLGETLSLADLALAPQLYHLTVTLGEWHPAALRRVEELQAVVEYRERLLELPCIKDTSYPREVVLWGWGKARAQ